ncbi:MAG: hydroxyacid dehydrogenase [bacterium]|nr:hydroxyacid dehydrogenase [bacterium]
MQKEQMKQKVTFFEMEDREVEYLKSCLGKDYDLLFFLDTIADVPAEEYIDSSVIGVFIYSEVTAAVMDSMPKLKLIATLSTGVDHIDLEAAESREITVCNVPVYGENTVAEHTFALVLALSRKIVTAEERVRKLDFSSKGLQGFDLQGKTIGVVGVGHIGLRVIRIAKGFGMNVLAYDIRPDELIAEVLGFRYIPLTELLGQSDIITLHVPLVKSTYHMINRDTVKQIKPGAILINTARGSLVETEALAEAMENGIIAGAGLDVYEGERAIREEWQVIDRQMTREDLQVLVTNIALLHRGNVVMTPHIGFYSREALKRILDTTVDNINCFFAGTPCNVIKPSAAK